MVKDDERIKHPDKGCPSSVTSYLNLNRVLTAN